MEEYLSNKLAEYFIKSLMELSIYTGWVSHIEILNPKISWLIMIIKWKLLISDCPELLEKVNFEKYSGQRLTSACGSPCYASPEMIEAKAPYDPQLIDVWSCGVILYAMTCGTLPFMESETSKLYKKIISGTYRPIKGVS